MKNSFKSLLCLTLLCGAGIGLNAAEAAVYVYDGSVASAVKDANGLVEWHTAPHSANGGNKITIASTDKDNLLDYRGIFIDNEYGVDDYITMDSFNLDMQVASGRADGISIKTDSRNRWWVKSDDANAGITVKGRTAIDIDNKSPRRSSYGIYISSGYKADDTNEKPSTALVDFKDSASIKVRADNRTAHGIYIEGWHKTSTADISFEGNSCIAVDGEKGAQGVYLHADKGAVQKLFFKDNADMQVASEIGNAFGVYGHSKSGSQIYLDFDRLNMLVDSQNINANVHGLYLYSENNGLSSANISNGLSFSNNPGSDSGQTAAIVAYSESGGRSEINIEGTSVIDTNGSRVVHSVFSIGAGSRIKINKSGNSGVKLNGDVLTGNGAATDITLSTADSYLKGRYDTDYGAVSKLNLRNGAVWQLAGTSRVSNLTADKGAVIDMRADGNCFITLTIDNLKGDGGVLQLDIDASKHSFNSDRVYIKGDHEGVHYVSLNNVNSMGVTDGAAGTILISVGNEKGSFKALPMEGKLYWKTYALARKDGVEAGYGTEWYLKESKEIATLPPVLEAPQTREEAPAVDEPKAEEKPEEDEIIIGKPDLEPSAIIKPPAEQAKPSVIEHKPQPEAEAPIVEDEPKPEDPEPDGSCADDMLPPPLPASMEPAPASTDDAINNERPAAKPIVENGSTAEKNKPSIDDSAKPFPSTEGNSNKIPLSGHTTSVDAIMSANALTYYIWLSEHHSFMQRMVSLRQDGAAEEGAWFRANGNKISSSHGISFENRYNTYELGYDKLQERTKDRVRYQGIALSYSDGNASYKSGSGRNHSKSISFYSTDQYNKGHYLDLVFRLGGFDNNFKVMDSKGQPISGDYHNKAVSVSAEYGRRSSLQHGWYVEPQAQLTLGYMGSADYVSSNGISVRQGDVTSILGRVGFNIGKRVGQQGVIYAKANLLHEFGGTYDVAMTTDDGFLNIGDSFRDTWLEYGIGAAVAVDDSSHIYFDVERSAGGDVRESWQWNAGVRYSF